MNKNDINAQTQLELEAAAFRRLRDHLRERTDVQNIDLMNLAGFCRNCLSKWYREEAEKKGIEISDPDARKLIYGMPYTEWKERYSKTQKKITPAITAKIIRQKDKKTREELRDMGYVIIQFYESEWEKDQKKCLQKIIKAMK